MSDVAIRVEGLSKQYRIGATGQGAFRYKSLRDSLAGAVSAPLRRLRRTRRTDEARDGDAENTIWALKDVSFEVKRGEVVGIIGRNGAGKSTLLKILSRITEPTEGWAEIHGRVGSLLEVGTGFHPELTGRENVYLNGAILGMRKGEIARKFDEIVAFAEVERFVDTPVKHYSSGMYVRLAFAVAAHLEPEILLVDEVLAVGDIEFQRKCIGKMEQVSSSGRAVAVVSHSMSTVRALCTRALLLERGHLEAVGPADAIVTQYVSASRVDAAQKIVTDEEHLTGVRQLRVRRITLLNGLLGSFTLFWQQPLEISVEIEVLERIDGVAFGAGVRALDGTKILTVHHDDNATHSLWAFGPGRYLVDFTLENDLQPGLYRLHIGADREHLRLMNLCALDAVTLEVLDHTEHGSTPLASNEGLIRGHSKWNSPRQVT